MQDDVQDKKEAIIRAALKLFTERGFDGTPTALISREAGVATGTLFRYFPTKEALINEAYAVAKEHMAAAMLAGVKGQKTLEGQLRLMWGNTIRWGLDNPEELLFLEQFVSSPYITRITEEEAMRSFNSLSELIEKGIREGKIKDLHRGLIIDVMFNANKAVTKKILAHGLQGRAEEFIESSFELVWSGLASR